jgi:hypothetical protein
MGAVTSAFGALSLIAYQPTTTPAPTAPKAKDDDDKASSSSVYATPPTSPPRPVDLPQTCEVCRDDILPETRLTTAITSTCKHPAQIAFCPTCIEARIHSQIMSLGWDNISYPVIKCGEKLGYNDRILRPWLTSHAATATCSRKRWTRAWPARTTTVLMRIALAVAGVIRRGTPS